MADPKVYLGFARKAGALAAGSGTLEMMIKKKRVKLVLISKDTASGTVEKTARLAESYEIPWCLYGESDELSHCTGYSGKHVFGITDVHLAKAIRQSIEEEHISQEKRDVQKDEHPFAQGIEKDMVLEGK